MAAMLENGFEPAPSIRRSPAGSLVRRSASSAGPQSSMSYRPGTSTIRRSESRLSVAPGPVDIVGQLSGDGPAVGVTTSQMLDFMDWINRIVDERLRSELERRGIAGGRW
jgi:hypothetical protein